VARPRERLVVFYDANCGLCAWGIAWLLRWDRARALRPVPIEGEQGARLLADMTAERRLASWHVLDEHGRRTSGGAALAPVLARLPAGAPLAALVRKLPHATEAAYAWVARHRSTLGRPISERARRRARAVIAARMH
jgi:predicted DCC family thiol-disulfide oxidoreductase YuxK